MYQSQVSTEEIISRLDCNDALSQNPVPYPLFILQFADCPKASKLWHKHDHVDNRNERCSSERLKSVTYAKEG